MPFQEQQKQIAIIGSTGFAAGELLRLLLGHPFVRVRQIVSNTAVGTPIAEIHPHLSGFTDRVTQAELDPIPIDVLFFCGRHGDAMTQLPALLRAKASLKVIDLTGDFRLRDPDLYPLWYGRQHSAPEELTTFVYGLPELFRESIKQANRIANPGCFATALALALAPLSRAGWLERASICATTGSSGAGAVPKKGTHHPTRAATMRAYKPLHHQHTPEIEQALKAVAPKTATPMISFVPVSGPFVRGIYAVCHAEIPPRVSLEELQQAYQQAYAGEPFVRLLKAPPDLQRVTGSNTCDLYVTMEKQHVVVITALDNLVKGAVGQALQNFNLLIGCDETRGLDSPSAYP